MKEEGRRKKEEEEEGRRKKRKREEGRGKKILLRSLSRTEEV